MKRIPVIVLVIPLAVLFLYACSAVRDANGPDDKSLTAISDDALANTISGSLSTTRSSKTGSHTYAWVDRNNITGEEFDYDAIDYTITDLNGTQKGMFTHLSASQTLTVTVDSSIKTGNFAAVLLAPDKTILARFEANALRSFTVKAPADGDYLLTIAGESAAGTLSMSRTIE